MIIKITMPLLAALTFLGAGSAYSQTSDRQPWFVRVGLAAVNFHERAEVTLVGAVVPGGNASLSNNTGVALELGYFFKPEWSASLTVGTPPVTTLRGAGTLSAAGVLGEIRYGPAVLAARYHLPGLGALHPYAGVGVNYTVIFRSTGKALQNFRADNAFGPAIVVGADLDIAPGWAVYADYKKVWASSNARFDLPTPGGLVPGTAKVTLNPGIVSLGVTYRF